MGPCRQCHLPLVLSIYGEYIIYLDQRDNSTNVMIFLANESILNAVGLKESAKNGRKKSNHFYLPVYGTTID